jgi:hypothetical protein
MMRLLSRLAAAVVCLAAATASAQTSAGISIGPSIPTGDLAAIDGLGYHVMAMVQTLPADKTAGFRFEAAYHAFHRKQTIQSITERVMYGAADIVLRPISGGATRPYLVGGFGMYVQGTSPSPSGASSSTELGYNVGGGVQFQAGRFSAFSELRYHQIMTEFGARFVPITVGILFK